MNTTKAPLAGDREESEMICSICGGRVEWQGRLSNLTHTKCLQCGAIGSQIPEPERSFDILDLHAEFCEWFEREAQNARCPNCGGPLEQRQYHDPGGLFHTCVHCLKCISDSRLRQRLFRQWLSEKRNEEGVEQ